MLKHKNEYILSRKRYIPREDAQNWDSIELYNGYVLAHEKHLKITANRDKSVVLIGNAWQVKEDADSPYKQVVEAADASEGATGTLLEYEQTWCGKYILIIGDRIYTDMVASMRAFYSDGIISNSVRSIAKIRDVKYSDELAGVSALNYFPSPHTPYEGIKRLMPSQILDYVNYKLYDRLLFEGVVIHFDDDEERASAFIKSFNTNIHNLYKEFCLDLDKTEDEENNVAIPISLENRLFLPLTGGWTVGRCLRFSSRRAFPSRLSRCSMAV